MKPSQLSAYLRRMASQIDSARSPRKDLVVRDLRRALAALTGGRRWANVPGGGGDVMNLTKALKKAIAGVAASEGMGGSFPIGNGADLFPDEPELDESSWSLTWSGDSTDPIELQAQHKHDIDVLLEFTLQEAQTEADKVVGMALKAIQADAAGGA